MEEGSSTWVNFTANLAYARWSKVHDLLIGENALDSYLPLDELTNLLMQLRNNHSDLVEVKASYGPPGETALQLVRITAKGNRPKPEVLLVGGLSGDRPVGRELLTRLARHLVIGYVKGDARVRSLLEAVAVHIVPTVDESGFRHSKQGVCEAQLSVDGALPDMENRFGPGNDGKFPVVEALKNTLKAFHYTAGLVIESGGYGIRTPLNTSNSGTLDNLTLNRLVEGFKKEMGQNSCEVAQRPVEADSFLKYAYSTHGTLLVGHSINWQGENVGYDGKVLFEPMHHSKYPDDR